MPEKNGGVAAAAPEKFAAPNRKTMSTAEAYSVRHVTVDSRDRDPAAHPDPAAFDVALDEPLRDVASVSLRAWKVPLPLPASQGHRVLWLEAHDGRQVGARTSAPYRCPADERAFLADLAAAAAAAAGQDFAIASSRGAVTVSSSRPFAVLGGSPAAPRPGDAAGRWSVAAALGFPRGRFPAPPAGGGFAAVAPHASTLHVPVDAYVRLRDAPCFEAPETAAPTGPCGCLAVVSADRCCLPADPDRPVAAVGSNCGRSSPVVRRFHPPLARVRRLRVSVVDYYGDVINTDNRDVRLDFVFRTSPADASSPCGFPINNPR
jgi:hypothetical protein